MRGHLALAAALLSVLASAGCINTFGPGYAAGWRIVDRDQNCSECEDVVYRTGSLDAAWSGRVEAGHDLWISYADPEADAARIRVNVTMTPALQQMSIAFGRQFWCPPEGGNATTDSGADWSVALRPGPGTCEADLDWGDGRSGTFVEVMVPASPPGYGSYGAGGPLDVTFTARRI